MAINDVAVSVTPKNAEGSINASIGGSPTSSYEAQLKAANAVGREHLKTLHCIDLGANATTYDIMNSISNIPPLQYAKNLSNFMQLAEVPENTEYTLYLPKCQNIEGFMFGAKKVKKVRFTAIDDSGAFFMKKAFHNCYDLEELRFDINSIDTNYDNCVYCGSFTNCIFNCHKLKKVVAVFDIYDIDDTSVSLNGCEELEEIRFFDESIAVKFSIKDSAKLSKESIDSIIEGLLTLDEQTTITLHADVVAKLTEEQMSQILDKNWLVQ